jgi:hypothetical protein
MVLALVVAGAEEVAENTTEVPKGRLRIAQDEILGVAWKT